MSQLIVLSMLKFPRDLPLMGAFGILIRAYMGVNSNLEFNSCTTRQNWKQWNFNRLTQILACSFPVMLSVLTTLMISCILFKNQKAWKTKSENKERKTALSRIKSVAGYLGIHMDLRYDGSIHLTQKGLIQKILDAMHLNDDAITSVETPTTDYLSIDLLGEKAHGEFNYASINGQLNYLLGHSRPDIGLAVS